MAILDRFKAAMLAYKPFVWCAWNRSARNRSKLMTEKDLEHIKKAHEYIRNACILSHMHFEPHKCAANTQHLSSKRSQSDARTINAFIVAFYCSSNLACRISPLLIWVIVFVYNIRRQCWSTLSSLFIFPTLDRTERGEPVAWEPFNQPWFACHYAQYWPHRIPAIQTRRHADRI